MILINVLIWLLLCSCGDAGTEFSRPQCFKSFCKTETKTQTLKLRQSRPKKKNFVKSKVLGGILDARVPLLHSPTDLTSLILQNFIVAEGVKGCWM